MARVVIIVPLLVAFLTPYSSTLALVSDPPIDPGLNQHRIIEFNMCGRLCGNWGSDAQADNVYNTIINRDPLFIVLNEVCRRQFNRLSSRLKSAGYNSAATIGVFDTTQPSVKGCGGNGDKDAPGDYGNAIFWRRGHSWQGAYSTELPNPSGAAEKRRLVCTMLTYQLAFPYSACTSHLVPRNNATNDTYNRLQIEEIAHHVRPPGHANTAFVGGDFNATPPMARMDVLYEPLYSPPGQGIFYEAAHSRSGSPSTHSSGKIDHIFFYVNVFPNQAYTTNALSSDHKIYHAIVDVPT